LNNKTSRKTAMNPFVESQELILDAAALKTRLDQDGYLFIRHLIPRNTIENVRQQTLAPAKTAGWLAERRDTCQQSHCQSQCGLC